MSEIIYILINSEMPKVVKIGRTDRDVETRELELFTTGVPVPFDCAYACIARNNSETEKWMHEKFSDFRVHPKREFFHITPEEAIKELKAFEIKDVTPVVRTFSDSKLTKEDKESRWQSRKILEKKNPKWEKLKTLHEM